MSVHKLESATAQMRDRIQRIHNAFAGIARDIRRRVFKVNKATAAWRGHDPARNDRDALAAADRIVADYPGSVLSLVGPQEGLWAAAIRRDATAPEAQFVTAELRPLAISLAILRFLDEYGEDAIRRIGNESGNDRTGQVGASGISGDGPEGP